ncbi:MAG: LiaF-related protein [Tannerella sp.]|jgi:predicted membrane protein|nr:LiaF-related protein [Tannerella sp.]
MNRQNFVLQAILSVALMTGSGFLLTWTLNIFGATAGALSVMTLILVAILIFTLGAVWVGRLACHTPGDTRPRCSRIHHGAVIALMMIAAGALLLAFNTGFLPAVWKGFFFSWMMLLFLFGAIKLCQLEFLQGIIFAAIGKFFLIDRLSLIYPQDTFYEQFASVYWPVLIIVVGLLIFIQLLFKPKISRFSHHQNEDARRCFRENSRQAKNENADGSINYSYIFSGTDNVFLESEFKGGTIEMIFGSVNLDLRRTSLPEGETRLYVHVLFGSIDITVPASWHVEVNPQAVFGGVDDKRPNREAADRSRKLVIDGHCAFGGITLR